MSKAYFSFYLKPKERKLSFPIAMKRSGIYSVKKVSWTKKPYFFVKERIEEKRIQELDVESIIKQFR